MPSRRIEPPFPSFTWVITAGLGNANVDGNLRLPTYRASHLGRYHPYPRTRRSVREDVHMITVDHRFDDAQPVDARSVSPLASVSETVVNEPGEDIKPAQPHVEVATDNSSAVRRRQTLKVLAQNVTALLAAMAQICRIAKAEKDGNAVEVAPTD